MTIVDAEPRRVGSLALRVVQIGAIAVVLAVTTFHAFELDRFFVPKELVLHLAATLAGLLAIRALWRMSVTRVDLLLAGYLALSALSALLATNRWLAMRALAVTASSILLFWIARALRDAGLARPLLGALAFAVVVAAATSLLQTYGLDIELFSVNRAPGGTLGNRNFVAHVAAFGFPLLLLCTLRAQRRGTYLQWATASALVVAALVLTRSRAAWLAFAVVMLVLIVAMIISAPLRRDRQVWKRLAGVVILAAACVALSLALPNALHWHGRNPYLDSVRNIAEYSEGSGRGRLVQYGHSLMMTIRHPLFGAGPGNWPVEYVRFAPDGDRSIADDGMTANPWPSSDWVAFISERGLVPTLALLGVFTILFFGALRRWSELKDPDAVLAQCVLAGTIVATMVVSAFDVVLLLAAPSFLVWSILGATSGIPDMSGARRGREVKATPRTLSIAGAAIIVVVLVSAARSVTQILSMSLVGRGGLTAGWVSGAMWDPGSYRINLRVAQLYSRRGKCTFARDYARQAVALFPHSPEARRIRRSCG